MYAVHAMAAASSIWLQPSSALGDFAVRAVIAPPVLPMARPTRNTARMMENVYTVATSISPSRRVQITSAASAVAPESAIVTYTGHAPGAITPFESLAGAWPVYVTIALSGATALAAEVIWTRLLGLML